jgi:hypothetical protein
MSARRDAELKQRADDLARRESEFATAMASLRGLLAG